MLHARYVLDTERPAKRLQGDARRRLVNVADAVHFVCHVQKRGELMTTIERLLA